MICVCVYVCVFSFTLWPLSRENRLLLATGCQFCNIYDTNEMKSQAIPKLLVHLNTAQNLNVTNGIITK